MIKFYKGIIEDQRDKKESELREQYDEKVKKRDRDGGSYDITEPEEVKVDEEKVDQMLNTQFDTMQTDKKEKEAKYLRLLIEDSVMADVET